MAQEANTRACIDPDLSKVRNDVSLMLCNGELAKGTLQLPPDCAADGVVNCLTTTAFKAADMTLVVPTNIVSGTSIAGVAGTVVAAPPACAADGETDCVTSTAFKAADGNLTVPAKIVSGTTIAGVSGTAIPAPATCSADGGVGCLVVGPSFKAADISGFTAASLRSGVTVAGVAGSLLDCSTNNVVGCVSTPTYKSADLTDLAAGSIKSGVTIAGVLGTLPYSGPADCTLDGEQNCVTTATLRAAKASDAVAGNIRSGVTLAGVTGTYGPACSADGDGACLVDGTTYKAATLANFQNTDVKSGVTIAGVAGALGNCADGGDDCVVQGPTFKAATSADITAGNIKDGATIGAVPGTYGPACSADGGTACVVDGPTYKAAAVANLMNGNIVSGVTLGGVAGNVTPTPGSCASDGASACVVDGTNYVAADKSVVLNSNIRTGVTLGGVTGNVVPTPGNCASDGAGSCVVDGTNYKAALLANFMTADVKTGVTIAGVSGNAALESHGNCASDGASGCVADGTAYIAADKTKVVNANIKSGVSLGGVTGNYGPACSADGGSACLVDGTTYKAAATTNLVNTNIKTGVTIGGVAGNVTPSPANCAADGASSCVVEGTNYVAANKSNAIAGNVRSGVSLAGVTGTYPSSGTPLDGANGTADLDTATFNAKIKSAAAFEWFDSVGNRYTHAGEPNITAGLLLYGHSVFGTVGTFFPGGFSTSALAANIGASKVALSWTRSGGTGVIIVRRVGASVTFTPTQGVNYAQGHTSGDHEVVFKGSVATANDPNVIDGTTYYYKAFTYNGDYAYSSASNEASVTYQDHEVCGGTGDGCYDDATAIADGVAITPSGKLLNYVTASGSFKVWKDAGSTKILRANGLDEWALKLNLDGKGFQGAGNEFTDYTSLEGRKCPPSVYIDDTNKVSSGNCLYYTVGYASQKLNAAGTTQTTASTIGLNDWTNYNDGTAKWYVGNIKTCSDKGMRLPTIFETTTTKTTDAYYPSDAAPTFAGASNGIPSHVSGDTWTASGDNYLNYSYWRWLGASADGSDHLINRYVRCALP